MKIYLSYEGFCHVSKFRKQQPISRQDTKCNRKLVSKFRKQQLIIRQGIL